MGEGEMEKWFREPSKEEGEMEKFRSQIKEFRCTWLASRLISIITGLPAKTQIKESDGLQNHISKL